MKRAVVVIACCSTTLIAPPAALADAASDHSRKGMGIGLNVVKRIVDLHGGSVEARSAGRGAGSEFVVSLPLVASRA